MREVILFIASSLDGYIAREDGGIGWLFSDADYGYSEFYGSIDTIIVGRKTYDQSLGFDEDSYKGKQAYVFTHDKRAGDGRADFVSSDMAEFIKKLKRMKEKNI